MKVETPNRMKPILPLLAALLLLGACERSEYTTRITGTLYTDSTLTVPVANTRCGFTIIPITGSIRTVFLLVML